MQSKKWIFKEVDNKKTNEFASKYKISKLTASVLQNRMDIFSGELNKNVKDKNNFYDPFLILDMEKAVERIRKAITNNEKITIYGDYDADGVTSTTILLMYLQSCGADVFYYIPDRVDEGYGIKMPAIEKIHNGGTTLIITVDTGVTAIDEASKLKELGIDLIVTDHHECKNIVPDCVAVIDPKREGCMYPFKDLAGVGVVFKLITALAGVDKVNELIPKFLPFVCLGTIADVAPLTDENRSFVKYGLRYLRNSIGISALLKVTNLDKKPVTAGNIGFIVAPRINAAGRLGSARKSVELFLCDNETEAISYAEELSRENKNRQELEMQIFSEAVELIEKNNYHKDNVIVIENDDWHHGVIGIVSSKITEKYSRPSFLISLTGEEGKGSGRSISGFNLYDALTHSGDTLIQFGGHSLAAGLSIHRDSIGKFRTAINRYAAEKLQPEDFVLPLYIDSTLTKDDLNVSAVENLKALEPYGMGNSTPVFALMHAKIKYVTTFTQGKHLKMQLIKDGGTIEIIGFNLCNLADSYNIFDVVDVAGTLGINEFNGEVKVQMLLKDIKISD